MTSKIKVLVLSGYGLNCDYESAHAFELAGASALRVHINDLISGSVALAGFEIMVFVGGFSWGDDHGAGVIQAVRLKNNIGDNILEFIEKGKLVIGICNGFQTLVNLGLLPGFDGDYSNRSVALTFNDCGNFRNQWVNLKVNADSPCLFTKGMNHMQLPIRHGEGKFYAEDDTIKRLKDNGQIVLQYADSDGNPAQGEFPFNPNGSVSDIAGICDATGRVFGLMPHPEAFHHLTAHPDWTRQKEMARRRSKDWKNARPEGLVLFKNAVNFFNL
jgi:phosphoribosylformylglycinamidine synthase I